MHAQTPRFDVVAALIGFGRVARHRHPLFFFANFLINVNICDTFCEIAPALNEQSSPTVVHFNVTMFHH